jgi:two-component system CheB/CheR fusion protein
LHAAYAVDFSLYRHTTVRRRILRRMVLSKAETLRAYLQLLRESPAEAAALHHDVLVHVTQFFRDPEAFEALQRTAFPKLLEARTADGPIRVWVPGCSTGEEVYSLAIALLEVMASHRVALPFQIFGTDVSDTALATARAGTYIENIAADVSRERLGRFFTRAGNRYRISKAIRDRCVFARHDITRDPPFSRLDLISCRNLLIYLEPALQRRLVPLFHYALEPTGYLMLGTSETVREPSELFSLVDKNNKIYTRSAARTPAGLLELPGVAKRSPEPPTDGPAEHARGASDAQREADRIVMSRYAPPGVVVDADLVILQFRGHTGPYLEPAPGEASLDVLKMAREGLKLDLRSAIQKARRGDAPVRVAGIRLLEGTEERVVSLEVIPLEAGGNAAAGRWLLVLFEEQGDAPRPRSKAARGRAQREASAGGESELERELAATKDYLRTTIDEHEAVSEELQSANEELLSSNEELLSINEELATAKAELQSANEELTTLNQELGNRNAELNRLNDDLGSLLSSVNIPIVMLGNDLRVRRFTPQAERIFNLIPSDVGRPIGDIKPRIDAPDLEQLLVEVIDTASARERDVQDREGRWYSLRVRPHRTADDKGDGAVVLLLDADRRRSGSPNEEEAS